jgi:hypothetical protein
MFHEFSPLVDEPSSLDEKTLNISEMCCVRGAVADVFAVKHSAILAVV